MNPKNPINLPGGITAPGVPLRRMAILAAVLLAVLFAPSTASCAVFSWPNPPAWAATGPASGSTETVDYSFNAQGSLAVSVFNSGMTWQTNYPQTANVGAAAAVVTGGTANGTGSLQLYATTAVSTASFAQVTINFNYTGGANNISFQLWDVDAAGSFVDTIKNIQATAVGGGTVYPTTLTGTAGFNTVTGTGAAAVVTGTANAANNTNEGTVNIAFTQTVSSITFQWSNSFAGTPLGAQAIGVGPITFTSIGTAFPEVGSAAGALALCGGLATGGRFRRRRPACGVSRV